MRHHLAVAATLGILLAFAAPASANSQTAVTIGATEVKLEPAKTGGGTATISLTNLTDKSIRLEQVEPPKGNPRCLVELDTGLLKPARTTSVTATIANACGAVTKALSFEIVPAGGVALPVDVLPPASNKVDWDLLADWFARSLIAAFVLMLAVYGAWMAASGTLIVPWESLPSLETSWSFKDSWVSSVTAITALATGVLGSSEVVKAILGKDADESLAQATIGSAVALALIAAAGVVVLLFKTLGSGKFTALGVLLGSAVALGAAGGQIGVIFESARGFDLGGREDRLDVYIVVALLLLAAYGFVSVLSVLIQGRQVTASPDPLPAGSDQVSETLFAAAVVAAASCKTEGCVERADVDAQLRRLRTPKKRTRRTDAKSRAAAELATAEAPPAAEGAQAAAAPAPRARRFVSDASCATGRAALP